MSQFIEMFNDSPLVRLEDHIETQSGGTPNTKKSEYYDGGTIPWLSSGEVNQGYISSTEKYITEEGLENSAAKWVPKNSVVIAMYGATAGKVGFITIPLTTNQAVCALLPNDAFNPLYLYYAVSSQKNWMIAQCRGAAQPNISQGIIRSMEIPMPSLSEQMQFVNIIKQADKSEFVGFKSQFIEMFGNGNWEQKALGEVGTFKRGGGFQKSNYVERGIPCIHYGQIHTKFGPFIYSHVTEISSDLESKTKFATKGDLIIAITSEDTEGSCKSTAWLGDYPVAVGGHAAIFHHCMNPVYMSFFFKSALFNYAKKEYVHGTKVCEIKPDDIAKILVPYPPMSLQEEFSLIAQQADKSEFELRKSIEAIDQVIKSLINN